MGSRGFPACNRTLGGKSRGLHGRKSDDTWKVRKVDSPHVKIPGYARNFASVAQPKGTSADVRRPETGGGAKAARYEYGADKSGRLPHTWAHGTKEDTRNVSVRGSINRVGPLATATPVTVLSGGVRGTLRWVEKGTPPVLRSYKEALLYSHPASVPPPQTYHKQGRRQAVCRGVQLKGAPRKRCFRCLGRDHLVRQCRDPLRCAVCFGTRHRARWCRSRRPIMARYDSALHRAAGFRPSVQKVFIPLTEEFFNRQRQRQFAVLADVIGRARLGHCPLVTIASDLAARFGGFATDFVVAKHQERDYAILLPQWMRPEDLYDNGLL